MTDEQEPDPRELSQRLSRIVAADTADDLAAARQAVEHLGEWLEPFEHVWSHVRVSAVGHRVQDAWIGRAVAVVLTDGESPQREAFSDLIGTAQATYPIDVLPNIVEDVWRGELSAARSPLRVPLVLREGKDGTPFRCFSSLMHEPSSFSSEPYYQFQRHVFELYSRNGFDSFFDAQGGGYRWLERARRSFEALGYGKLESVGERLGIPSSRTKFWNEHPSIFQLIAPLPISLDGVSQGIDRTRIGIPLELGRLVRPDRVRLTVEPKDAVSSPTEIPVSAEGGIEIPAPSTPTITLHVSYCERHVLRHTFRVHPPLRFNVRQRALAAFERAALLEEGLDPKVGQPKEKNSDAFERSVAHLLGLLGFSACWWGPHKNGPRVPQEQADILAWSSDDSVVLVVDCTLEPGTDVKSSKVFNRAKELERALVKDMVTSRPRVIPVLALGIPYEQVAELLREPGEHAEVTVFALDHMKAALDGLRRGLPHSEIVADLPPPLRMGFEAHGLYHLSPDPHF